MGAGPARERERSSRQGSRDAGSSGVRCSVSETRCNGGAFRDRSSHPWPLLVWPSLAKQLPPGTTIAPLTLQRHRHGSVPPFQRGARTFQFPKERRDRVGPSRTVFGQGWPNAEPTGMYSWRVLDGPTRSRCGLSGEKSLWDPAGWLKPPFRGRGPLPQPAPTGPGPRTSVKWSSDLGQFLRF